MNTLMNGFLSHWMNKQQQTMNDRWYQHQYYWMADTNDYDISNTKYVYIFSSNYEGYFLKHCCLFTYSCSLLWFIFHYYILLIMIFKFYINAQFIIEVIYRLLSSRQAYCCKEYCSLLHLHEKVHNNMFLLHHCCCYFHRRERDNIHRIDYMTYHQNHHYTEYYCKKEKFC